MKTYCHGCPTKEHALKRGVYGWLCWACWSRTCSNLGREPGEDKQLSDGTWMWLPAAEPPKSSLHAAPVRCRRCMALQDACTCVTP